MRVDRLERGEITGWDWCGERGTRHTVGMSCGTEMGCREGVITRHLDGNKETAVSICGRPRHQRGINEPRR